MCSKELHATDNNEAQLDKYISSLDTVYEITASLNKYTTVEVLFYAAQTLSKLMESPDVAIYTVANRDYARLFAATSQQARTLGNSIKYTDLEALHETLKSGQIYINREDPKLPRMAGAIYAEDEIQVFLMFWGIPDQELTTRKANRLAVIATLIQNAILRAKRYMSSFRRHHYMEGTGVLNEESFTALVKTFLEAKEKGLTECALAEIVMGYHSYEQIAETLICNIRQTDYMGIMDGGKLYILLSNTDIANAEVVKARIHKLGYNCVLKDHLA